MSCYYNTIYTSSIEAELHVFAVLCLYKYSACACKYPYHSCRICSRIMMREFFFFICLCICEMQEFVCILILNNRRVVFIVIL